jgi:hypothetical protein
MAYDVKIRDLSTGEIVTRHFDLLWEDGSEYLWSEGNFSCDCNRALEFSRAKGVEAVDSKCSYKSYPEGRFRVESITLTDGAEVYKDDWEVP